MKKKVGLLIGAAAVVAVAAVNVNVSFKKGKAPNVSLANARALANGEDFQDDPPLDDDPCVLSTTSIGNLSTYKMALTNYNREPSYVQNGIAIRNDPSPIDGYNSSVGLNVEQTVGAGRDNIAIKAFAQAEYPSVNSDPYSSFSTAYGVYAVAGNADNGYNYGVFTGLRGCNNGAALYATTSTSSYQQVNGKFAGYFRGAVHATSVSVGGAPSSTHTLHVSGNIGLNGQLLQLSDGRHKTNVKNLGSALDQIAKLRPVTYNFKPEDVSKYYELVPDSVKITNENQLRKYFDLGKKRNTQKKHIGFIAQELQAVFPELVHSDKEGTLSVDYVSLVPVLAGAIQEQSKTIQGQNKTIQKQNKVIEEQNETIDKMNEAIELLSKRLEALESAKEKTTFESSKVVNAENQTADKVQLGNFSFSMFPNPASSGSVVTIDYTMHVDAPIAIELYNMMGQKVRQILPSQHQQAGTYSVQTSISGLNVGTCIVRATSGSQVESKQLLIN